MAEEIILKVGVEGTGDGETKIKSLKAQLKEMKNELLGLDEGSERFKTLSKQAGELTDKIGDVNDKVKALASDTKKLDALVGVGSAIAGGFQAAQGAMALFGSDSKKVEEAIKNIIAVQGILNGVQQVGQFITAKGIVQTALWGEGSLLLAAKTKIVTAAQWLWNIAVSAFPVTAIVVGIGLLIAGIAKLADGIIKGTITIQDMTKVLWRIIMPLQLIVDLFNHLTRSEEESLTAAEKAAKRRAELTAEETAAHKERLNQINEEQKARIEAADEHISALELERDTLEANGKSSADVTIKILEAEKEKTKAVLDGNTARLQSWITYYTNLAALNGQSEDEFKATMKAQGTDLDALHQKALGIIADNEAAVQYSENAITKFKREQSEERADLAQQEADKQKAIRDKEEAERLKAEEEQFELNAQNALKYRELIANRNQFLIDEEAKRLDAEFDLMEAQIDRENASKDLQEQQDAERKARNLKAAEDFANASVNLVNTVFTLTNRLGKQDDASKEARAKRQFQISKALQLGLAVMDGYKAVTASLAQSPVAIGPVPNPAGIASLAFAVSTSLANIAKIASSQYGGGGGDISAATPNMGGGGDSVGSTTPNITPIQAGSTFLNPEPQKVYVLEADITGTQKKVNAIEAEATF